MGEERQEIVVFFQMTDEDIREMRPLLEGEEPVLFARRGLKAIGQVTINMVSVKAKIDQAMRQLVDTRMQQMGLHGRVDTLMKKKVEGAVRAAVNRYTSEHIEPFVKAEIDRLVKREVSDRYRVRVTVDLEEVQDA